MKKTLLSLLTVGAVGSAAFAATGAFFSDTETSTGNIIQAGDIDLKVDSTAHYVGLVCKLSEAVDTDPPTYVWFDETPNDQLDDIRPELEGAPCEGTFQSKDLVSDKFFNLSDIKPGDWGENTLSLTVQDNDAWACIDIENLVDAENQINEPEATAGDVTPAGELSANIRFTAWLDQGATLGWQNSDLDEQNNDPQEGDNVWQGETAEPVFFSNEPASNVLGGATLALAEGGDTPLPGGVTNYIGLAWCAGMMDANDLSCDGTPMGNDTQTDSLTADLTFRVEQSRNNPDFKCVPELDLVAPDQTN